MSKTFRCTKCENGPCYCCSPNISRQDAFGNDSGENRPYCCPYSDEEMPNWRISLSPAERAGTEFLVEELINFVDEHYDDVPQFVRDAAYGQLIQRSRTRMLKAINLLHMMAEDDGRYYGYEASEELKKAINSATKKEIINDIIPGSFAAGAIYAYIRMTTGNYKDIEDPEKED